MPSTVWSCVEQLPDDVHLLLVCRQVAVAKGLLGGLVVRVGLGDQLLRGAAQRDAGERGRRAAWPWPWGRLVGVGVGDVPGDGEARPVPPWPA